jgi:hypothetical protein
LYDSQGLHYVKGVDGVNCCMTSSIEVCRVLKRTCLICISAGCDISATNCSNVFVFITTSSYQL